MNKIMTVVCLLLTPVVVMAGDRYSASGKSSSTPSHSIPANRFSPGKPAAKKSTTLASSSHRSTSSDGVQRSQVQYLKITEVGRAIYFDEGNGQPALK
jgi:hypothetical protein